MDYEIGSVGKVTKVSLVGRLVASCSESFKSAMLEALKDSKQVLFDLKGMEHIDSSGLGVLVSLLQWTNNNGCSLKLCCLQPRPRIVFDITKVCRVFDIYATEAEALAAFDAQA